MSSSPGLPAVFSDGLITDTYDLSSFNANAPAPGTVRVETNSSGQVTKYRFVKNTSGSSIAANKLVSVTADQNNLNYVSIAPNDSSPFRVRGATMAALAANYGGWVIYNGIATVTADASTGVTKAIGVRVGAVTSGTVQAVAAVTAAAVGLALGSANVSAGDPAVIALTLPD
jgi:hypothetical protein